MALRAVLVAVLVLLAAPAGASAAGDVEIGMEDERLLLNVPAFAPFAVAAWRDLGVDVVRLHASWSRIAPAGRRRPRGFRARNHRSRRYRWAELDYAVNLVRANDMRVMLTVTGPGPVWTSQGRPRKRGAYKPSPREFGAFARAVATRYGDRVDRYLMWNEPNLSIAPRRECKRSRRAPGRRRVRRCTDVSPHIYRALVRAAGPAIERADRGAEIVVGELAPLPLEGALGPIRFLRAMACVDDRYKRIRTGRCRRFRPVKADALGLHPHGRRRAPDRPNRRNRDAGQMGDLPRILRVVDRLTRRGRIRAPRRRLPLRITELGYQTSPPDRFIGVSPARQAIYLQKAAFIAGRNPRVATLTQYQWEDERVRRAGNGRGAKRYAGWQSGLHFYNGAAKPALAAFARPLVALEDGSRAGALLWGQVRAGGSHGVLVQRWDAGFQTWVAHATLTTDERGVFALRLGSGREGRGRFRYAVLGPDGATPTGEVSSAVPVTRRPGRAKPRLVAAR